MFRLLHRHLTATFVAWRDDVRETGAGRRVQQQRAAGRMMNRHFVATFLPWAELTRRLSAARLSAEELGAACKRRGMQAHMLAWVAQRREQEQAREMVLQSGLYGVAQGSRCDASQCITVAAAVRTLVEWRGAARASAERRALLNKKAYVLGTRRTLFSLFYKWSAVPRQRRAVVTHAAFAICFRARRRMDSKRRELADRTFNKWRQVVTRRPCPPRPDRAPPFPRSGTHACRPWADARRPNPHPNPNPHPHPNLNPN